MRLKLDMHKVYTYVHTYVRMYVCMHVCVDACIYVRMFTKNLQIGIRKNLMNELIFHQNYNAPTACYGARA